jgi:hypothetical protein
MMPRTAIVQIAKMIGRELQSGVGPSEEALAVGPILAEAGAANEIVGSLLAEAHRKRPDDRILEFSPLLALLPYFGTAGLRRSIVSRALNIKVHRYSCKAGLRRFASKQSRRALYSFPAWLLMVGSEN